MNFRLTQAQLAHLRAVGVFIDGNQRPTVFDGGFVGFSDATESEVMKDVAGKETGSQSGTRPGRRARARRAQAPDHAFRSDALEGLYGTEFRILAQHYEALAFEDQNGLWVVVACNPLGENGPEVHFVVAAPTDQRVFPRAWAFARICRDARLMSLKHTNFPDASICAFPHGHLDWPNDDGLLGLVDIYVLWAVRKLHRDFLGWWPGPQVGACAFYRLQEFDLREHCGCGSDKRYGECHYPLDMMVDRSAASTEFRRLFECDFENREPPKEIVAFARSRWRSAPSMASTFRARSDPSRLVMI